MTKRIFRSICVVAVLVFLTSLSVSMGVLYTYFTQGQLEQLKSQAKLIAIGTSEGGISYLSGLDDLNCRITWVSHDGDVLYDSENSPLELENHLQREEIQDALKDGYGESTRYSVTYMDYAVYVAQRLPDGSLIRLSTVQYTVPSLLLRLGQPISVVILIMVAVCLWLAYRLSHFVVQPLNSLNLDDPLSNAEYEELKPLLVRIDSQQRQMKSNQVKFMRKQREFDTVTDNMCEGLVLMNESCTVLTMNPAAAKIMGMVRPYVGVNFLSLTHAKTVEPLLQIALGGNHGEDVVHLPMGLYQVDASPVRSGEKVSGVVLLMFDITEKQEAEVQRREFTANVSHELKTPLHAISGYAELLKSGMVQSGDVSGFAEKIYTEAQRMVRLVEDILKLSRLDEGAADMQREQVDLYTLAEETVRMLMPAAQKVDVTLSLSGGSAVMTGVPQLLSGIIMNLCTNAVKYNRPGGRVDVSVTDEEDAAVLTVADTGIGIPAEHQARIFERFYRVDKSHSKSVGGTGLGLSIVKHSALIHHAKVELESQENVGTTIRIRFPK